MIKSKPDIKSFNKDPNDFLEGGEADKALSKYARLQRGPSLKTPRLLP